MSPLHFPLVLFHPFAEGFDPNRRSARRPTIDAPHNGGVVYENEQGVGEYDLSGGGDDPAGDLPSDLDDVTRARKLKELCSRRDGGWDGRCLVGKRPVGLSSRSRLLRLLDGVPTVPSHTPARAEGRTGKSTVIEQNGMGGMVIRGGNTSVEVAVEIGDSRDGSESGNGGIQTAGGAFVASLIFLVGLWYLSKRHRSASTHPPIATSSSSVKDAELTDLGRITAEGGSGEPEIGDELGRLANGHAHAVHVTDYAAVSDDARAPAKTSKPPALPDSLPTALGDLNVSPDSAPHPPLLKESLSVASNAIDAADDLDGADEDSDRGNDNLLTPGKKKGGRRRKRGKKGKGAAGSGANGATGAEGEDAIAVEGKGKGGGEGGESKEKESGPIIDVPLPSPALASPALTAVSGIVTMQQQVPPPPPLLKVTDEVLGA